MRRFERFLFFYSILAITILLISLGVFNPNPLNLITGVVLAPLVFYFWVRLTSPEGTSAEKWSLRFLIVIVILSLLGVYGFHLAKQDLNQRSQDAKLKDLTSQNEDLKAKLASANASASAALSNPVAPLRVSSASGESVADLISNTPSPTLKQITGRSGVMTLDVFQDPLTAPQKIATVDGTINYSYQDKQGNWYKIVLSDINNGWVSSAQVQEVQ